MRGMENPDLPSLQALVGNRTLVRIIAIDEHKPKVVKIVAVESSGIWIEAQDLIQDMMSRLKITATPKTLVFFVPFSGISWIMSSANYPALSEKGLLGE
jgi:hypothetical protein